MVRRDVESVERVESIGEIVSCYLSPLSPWGSRVP